MSSIKKKKERLDYIRAHKETRTKQYHDNVEFLRDTANLVIHSECLSNSLVILNYPSYTDGKIKVCQSFMTLMKFPLLCPLHILTLNKLF